MQEFTLTELRRDIDTVLSAAETAPVSITRYGKPYAVIMPIALYERLSSGLVTDTPPVGRACRIPPPGA